MDAVTAAVREMYTAYPYPSGRPKLRQGCDPALIRSWVEPPPAHDRKLRVLDAGCGRGVGLIASASIAPEVEFLGVDLCERSLAAAESEILRRGLCNVRLAQVDLMTLEGLETPELGFDVVVSSGVLHHLSDPARGLAALRNVLAKDGVLSVMVYCRNGRADLYRLVRAIDALVPRTAPLDQRLAVGRALVAEQAGGVLDREPWTDLEQLDDAEFVDRYLNVNERSFDLPELFEWFQSTGFEFLRWAEPKDWDPAEVLRDGATLAGAYQLPDVARFRLVDELSARPSFELALVHPGTRRRAGFRPETDLDAPLAWSPEAVLVTERRHVAAGERVEKVTVRVRRREQTLSGSRARVALLAEGQSQRFSARALLLAGREAGLEPSQTLSGLRDLLAREALFRPHATSSS